MRLTRAKTTRPRQRPAQRSVASRIGIRVRSRWRRGSPVRHDRAMHDRSETEHRPLCTIELIAEGTPRAARATSAPSGTRLRSRPGRGWSSTAGRRWRGSCSTCARELEAGRAVELEEARVDPRPHPQRRGRHRRAALSGRAQRLRLGTSRRAPSTLPLRDGEALDLDPLPGLRRVDDPAAADVEADVAEPVEEDEVAGLEVARGRRRGRTRTARRRCAEAGRRACRRRRRRARSSRTRSASCRRSGTARRAPRPRSGRPAGRATGPRASARARGQRHRACRSGPGSQRRERSGAASQPTPPGASTRQSASRQMRAERAMRG